MVEANKMREFKHTFTFSPMAIALSEEDKEKNLTLDEKIQEAIAEVKSLGAHVNADITKNRKGETTGIRRTPETYTLAVPTMEALGIQGAIEQSVFTSMLDEAIVNALTKGIKDKGEIPEYSWGDLLTKLKDYYEDSDSSDGLGRKVLSKVIESFTSWREKNKKDSNGTKLITNAMRKKFDYESTYRLRQNLDLIIQGMLTWIGEIDENQQNEFADAVEKLVELAEKAKTLEAPIEPTANMFG